MTGFKIWYVLTIILIAVLEGALGFCSLRRNKGSIYAPVEKMYIERHGTGTPRHYTEEEREDARISAIYGQAAFFAILAMACLYGIFGESAVKVLESFTTIDQPFHRMVSCVVAILLSFVLLTVVLVGIRSFGRRLRYCLLYCEVDAYKEGEEDGKANVHVMHGAMQAMYAPTTQRLEAEAASASEAIEATESFRRKQEWFNQCHEEVYYDPANVARRQERERSIEASRNRLYETLEIDPQAKPLTPLEQLNQAFGIAAD